MKKTILSTLAISLFALPMTLQAGPQGHDTAKSTAVKPLSAMKSTMASPSQSNPAASKASDSAAKASEKMDAMETKPDSTQKLLEEAEKIGKKKAADSKK